MAGSGRPCHDAGPVSRSKATFDLPADLLDRYRGDPEHLAWLYRRAMELELAFFQAAWDAA